MVEEWNLAECRISNSDHDRVNTSTIAVISTHKFHSLTKWYEMERNYDKKLKFPIISLRILRS